MELRLIRNATLRLTYAGRSLLVDPYLAEPGTLPPYRGRSPNPLVPLPCPAAEVVAGVELVLVSHLHTDHFDAAAQALLPANIPLLCQPGDEAQIQASGFSHVTPLESEFVWQGITIRRTPGRHGSSPAILRAMGPVSGFLLRAAGEPNLYWAGDTVWTEEIAALLAQEQPDVIVIHAGGAVWDDNETIIMDAEQAIAVCRAAPAGIVVATHIEALDHCLVTRLALRQAARQAGIPDDRLLIPADGQSLTLA